MFNIIHRRRWWFLLSGLLLVPGIIALVLWGLKPGIDFTGGTRMVVSWQETRPDVTATGDALAGLNYNNIAIQPTPDKGYAFKLPHIDNTARENILATLREKTGAVEEKSFEAIGPTIGRELRDKAYVATILVLLGIVLYIAWAFRSVGANSPVSSWTFGGATIIALVHDILMVVGTFAILGHFLNIEIDALFVTALLTVLGFSVHDTIVVFDRIRERTRHTAEKSFETVVNESINQTLVRSLNTSLTVLIVLVSLLLYGGESIRNFVLALAIGIASGTYSSIFVASPLLVVWERIRAHGGQLPKPLRVMLKLR